MNKRNLLLDYTRAVACILVVLYHYTSRFEEMYANTSSWSFRLPWGWMAVWVFYILSGYLAIANKKDGQTIAAYIKEKALRLFPAYWVCMMLTFIVTGLFLPDKAVTIPELLVNLTMLESFLGVKLVDGAYWTLANELVFYAFFAIVVVLVKKRDKFQWFTLAWMLVLLVFHFVERDGLLFAAFGKLIARPYGHMFVAGSSLHFLLDQSEKRRPCVISLANLILALAYHYFAFGAIGFFFFLGCVAVVGLCVFLGNKGVAPASRELAAFRPLRTIAAISYPLYLLHQYIGYAILNGLIANGYCSEFIILIPACIMICGAYCVHRFAEIPVTKRFRKNAS